MITGTATDATSTVSTVRVSIKNETDTNFWNGSIWTDITETNSWINATGTDTWSYGNPEWAKCQGI